MVGLPGQRDARAGLEHAERLVREAVADHPPRAGVDVELRVHPEIDDLGDRAVKARSTFRRLGIDLHPFGSHGDANRISGRRAGVDGNDEALVLSDAHHRIAAD